VRKSIPAHAVLLAIYPILFLYAQNADFALPSEAFVPLALAAGVSIILLISLSLILRDRDKAGLLVSLLAILFFSYGHLSYALAGFNLTVSRVSLGADALLLPLWGSLLGMGTYSILKMRRQLHIVTNLLNIVAVCLVLFSLLGIVSYVVRTRARLIQSTADNTDAGRVESAGLDTARDIYYIILDAYASAEVLQETWGYNNDEFMQYLTEKGFHVVPDAHTNYSLTFLSLASSLNMEYLNYLGEELGKDSRDRSIPYQMTKNSEVVRFLRSRGYKFVHFQTGWGSTARNISADRDVQCGNVSEFTEVLLRTTILRTLADRLISQERRSVVLCTFSTLPEVQHTMEGPRFVFAHILVPHPPFLFGPNGDPISADPDLQSKDWMKYYVGQLQFVNKKVEELIDRILSEAERPPIIILQADHGSKSIREPGPEMFKERFGILNAYYLPNDGQEFLYDSITPVNTFRLIFNVYFDASYDLLQDRIYLSWIKRPYDFLDVTDTVIGS
jgi:hypothetical protein